MSGSEAGSGGVETLVGKFLSPIPGLDRPLHPQIHLFCPASELTACKVGHVF